MKFANYAIFALAASFAAGIAHAENTPGAPQGVLTQELLDYIASTDERKKAFAEEDARRVELLQSYVPGETTYASVCGDWRITFDAHWGFIGFSKTGGNMTIIMARDLRSVMTQMQRGYPSMALMTRADMLNAMGGSCEQKPDSGMDFSFSTDLDVQCELSFEGGILTENGCAGAEVLPMSAADSAEPAAAVGPPEAG